MSETHSKESDFPALSYIGSSVERYSSVVDSAYDARQNRPRSIPDELNLLRLHYESLHYKGLVLTYKGLLPFS